MKIRSENTTISISRETKALLDKKKIIPSESNNAVLKRILYDFEDYEDYETSRTHKRN